MRILLNDGRVTFTWEVVDGDVVATVTDEDSDVNEVDLVLTDWSASDPSPTVKEVRIRKQKGLAARDIRVPIGKYVEGWASSWSQMMALAGDDRRLEARQRRRRREITDDFLRDVAETYRAAETGERIAAVKAAHPASDSQVYRWLATARERGILEEA
jgi:hypothetical protein